MLANDAYRLEQLNQRTREFMRHRLNLFRQEPKGSVLRSELKIPYLPLPTPAGPWDEMLQEAFNVSDLFVRHRSDDSEGWKSLCLHGIDSQKTMSCDRYGYATEADTPYRWTEIADRCPKTVAWLKSLKDEGYFTDLYRIRYMWLEPDGFINFHRDRPEGKTSLGPLNVALNMPRGCRWIFKHWGTVPFTPGASIAVDVSNLHGVWNFSESPRIHIIIHGRYGPAYYKALERGSAHLLSELELPTQATTASAMDLALWRYLPQHEGEGLERKLAALSKHFLKLKSSRGLNILEDYNLRRILLRALENGSTWVTIITPGTMVGDRFQSEVQRMVDSADKDTFLFAHLLDRKDRGYGFHEQAFSINCEIWDKLGRPDIGWRNEGPRKIQAGERSEENVHDDYTPLFVRRSAGEQEISNTVLGWNFIDKALQHGFKVENFPDSVRDTKFYMYPEMNGLELERQIDLLNKPPTATPLLSEYQNLQLAKLRMEVEGFDKKTFLFNTEGTYEFKAEHRDKKLDHLYSLAAGFKDLLILKHHGWTDCTAITYFDISPTALFVKRKMFEGWDGTDFPRFFKQLVNDNPDQFTSSIFTFDIDKLDYPWQQELQRWGGADAFREVFEAIRPLPKRFETVNLISNPQWIAAQVLAQPGKHQAIWFSNCFNYTPALAEYDWSNETMAASGSQFLNGLLAASLKTRKDVFMYGEDILTGAKAEHCGHPVTRFFT